MLHRWPTRPDRGPERLTARTERVTTATARKRLDLQGLRAVAVLLVALNHAQVPFLKGGYVGVDVFFVLSGYFITGLLLREGFGRGGGLGRISIRDFYARRARRILPAACLTLLTTSIAVYVLYDLMGRDFLQTKPVLEDALAASLFFVNIHFISMASNYFAQATSTLPSPFTHFWSLSVEEQFYIVWPSLLALAFLLCRRPGFVRLADGVRGWATRARRRTNAPDDLVERQRRDATWLIGLLIALGCGASLWWSIHETAVDPQAAYYSTPVRAWEFGCGAGLALLSARPSGVARLPRALLGWLGLAMIAAAAVLFSDATGFPGDAALLPVGGAGLIILAGMLPARGGIARPLGCRPLAYIGDRSYAFYLWHLPVLVLVWQAAGHVLPVPVNLGLLAGAFALSALTYGLYENPLRFARWMRGWRTAAMVPVSLTTTVLAVAVPITLFDNALSAEAATSHRANVSSLRPAKRQPHPTSLWAATPIPAVGVAAAAARHEAALPKAIVPSMQELERENQYISYDIPKGCQPRFGNHATGRICKLGDSSSRRVVAVIGDSHAGMWLPALEADGREQKFAVVPLDKPGCVLVDIHKNLPGWPCGSWYRWALRDDHKLHPLATIVSFQLSNAMQAQPATTTGELDAVLGQVDRGVLLTDPPGQTQQPAQCISQPGTNMGRCSSRVPGTYVPLMRSIAGMAARTHHPAIPTLQWFCARGVCPMVVDHTLTLRDMSHFTLEYSADLAPVLGPELKPILARLGRRQRAGGSRAQSTPSDRRSASSRAAMCSYPRLSG